MDVVIRMCIWGDETEQYVAKRLDGEMRARPERRCATCLETKKMREG
jgi:hypothetical protein